MLTMIW